MNREQATGDGQPETGNEFRKGADIANRLLAIGARIVRLARALPRDVSGRQVASQIVRSTTSSGANYEEARAAESRADFVHKVGIAAKELRETIYWLRLIQASSMTSDNLDGLIREATELTAILVASSRTARRNAQAK
jgi:four helix bundle protein